MGVHLKTIAVLIATAALGSTPAGATTTDRPLAELRAWAAHTNNTLAAPTTDARVEHRIAVLRRTVDRVAPRLLRARADVRSIDTAATATALDRAIAPLALRLNAQQRYFFFLAYQAQLERLAERAGLPVAPTGRPTWSAARDAQGPAGSATSDTDGDGIVDVADRDDDGDGIADARDLANGGWGIPDGLAVRAANVTVVPGWASVRRGFCVFVNEAIPSPRSMAEAAAWQVRATRRGCSRPFPAAEGEQTALTHKARAKGGHKLKLVAFSDFKLGLRRAALEGSRLTLSVKAARRGKTRLTFAVVTGRRAILSAVRAVTVRRTRGFRVVRVFFPRGLTLASAGLRVTARRGPRVGSRIIPLRILVPIGTTIGQNTANSSVGGQPGPAGPQGPPGRDGKDGATATPTSALAPAPAPTDACPNPDLDTDGDLVSDCTERAGGDMVLSIPSANCQTVANVGIVRCATEKTVHVTSDPTKANTDNDAVVVDGVTYQLTDTDEWRDTGGTLQSDPSRKDTDADGLSDVEENFRWGTFMRYADSDSDAIDKANPGPPVEQLFDGAEIHGGDDKTEFPQTAPVASDTDGDGYSDLTEYLVGTINPRLAEIPSYEISLKPRASITLDVPTTKTKELHTELVNETETTDTQTDSSREQFAAGLRDKVALSVEVGNEGPVPTSNVTFTAEHESTFSTENETKTDLSTESRQLAQKAAGSSDVAELADKGSIAAEINVRNTSTTSGVRVKNLEIRGYFICAPRRGEDSACTRPGELSPIPVPFRAGKDITFATADSPSQDVTVVADGVPTPIIEQIAAHPSNLVFRPAPADIEVPGVNGSYADTVGTSVTQSTTALSIDFGGGDVRHWNIASGVDREWGKVAAIQAPPITIAEAFGWVGLDYETAKQPDGTVVLKRVANVSASAVDPKTGALTGAWAVGATPDAKWDGKDFNDLTLAVLGSAKLVNFADADGDGLFRNEEDSLGTDDTKADTDGDGVTRPCNGTCPGFGANYPSDWFETRVGWRVGDVTMFDGHVVNYRTFSDPLRCDADEDGLHDGPGACQDGIAPDKATQAKTELSERTDPLEANTDQDFDESDRPILDAVDKFPLAAYHFDGSIRTVTAKDMCGTAFTYDASTDWCVVPAGKTITNNGQNGRAGGVALCAEGQRNCGATTGYWRLTWRHDLRSAPTRRVSTGSYTAGHETREELVKQRLGVFSITVADGSSSRRRTILRAGLETLELAHLAQTNPELYPKRLFYFRTYGQVKDLRVAYRAIAGTSAFGDVMIKPISREEFLDHTNEPNLTAIAIPGRELIAPASEEDDLNDPLGRVPLTGTANNEIATTSPDELQLPAMEPTGWDARFGFSFKARPAAFFAVAGVTSGVEAGPDSDVVELDRVGEKFKDKPDYTYFPELPQEGPTPYVGASDSRRPLVQSALFGGSFASSGGTSGYGATNYAQMLFDTSTTFDSSRIGLPILTAGDPGTALDNVVLEPMGPQRDLVDIARMLDYKTGAGDPSTVNWTAIGFHPLGSIRTTNPDDPTETTSYSVGSLLSYIRSPSVTDTDDGGIRLGGAEDDGSNDSEISGEKDDSVGYAFRADPSYNKWATVLRRGNSNGCADKRVHLTTGSVDEAGDHHYDDPKWDTLPTSYGLFTAMTHTDKQTRTSLRIESKGCDSHQSPQVYLNRAIYMTKPANPNGSDD